jgi:hypothetical protein
MPPGAADQRDLAVEALPSAGHQWARPRWVTVPSGAVWANEGYATDVAEQAVDHPVHDHAVEHEPPVHPQVGVDVVVERRVVGR